MEPTDNFSQKKKKDLVAIATLFGILTEEKANRMTKPELIEFLAEQDRKSKNSSAPVQNQPEISADDDLLRATDLMIAAIKDSNLVPDIESSIFSHMSSQAAQYKSDNTQSAIPEPAAAGKLPVKAAAPKTAGADAKPAVKTAAKPAAKAAAKPAAKTAAKPAVIPAVIPASKAAAKAATKSPEKAEAEAEQKPAVPVTVSKSKKPVKNETIDIPAPEAAPLKTKPVRKVSTKATRSEISEEPAEELHSAAEPVIPAEVISDVSAITPTAAIPAEETAAEFRPEAEANDSGTVNTPVVEPAAETAEVIAESKKRRGRPKKSTNEKSAVTPAVPVVITAGEEISTYAKIIAQDELTAQSQISAQDEIIANTDISSQDYAVADTYQDSGEADQTSSEIQTEAPITEAAKKTAPTQAESHTEPAHHAARPRRHSVIIKPKDEDDSAEEQGRDITDRKPDTRDRAVFDEKKPSDEGSAAPSQEHAEGAHHARMLRPKEQPQEMLSGVLELMSEGYGFLRRDNYLQGQNDIYVPAQYVRRFGLRLGDFVVGPCRPKRDSDRYQALQYIKEVNGMPPEKMIRRPHFDRLTPIYPQEKYILETDKNELSTRIIDLVAPIGKGQRGMIVSPPKAGKTILLQKIANAISINNPGSKLIVLLIDERPEEVTDMQRSINGEVVYSTFDKTPENHVRIVELVLERAMRLVELGQDVVILLDSITRLSRAYNLTINPTGRTLSGGLDPGALYGPKRFFGAARNIEDGGSLTIVATSLIDTGSRMDEVIFEEFKGTGNMEVYLDRKLSEKRIFPAIDINKSGTRREELLLSPVELDAVWTIRKAFGQLDTAAVTEMIISLLMKTQTNNQFVQSINVSFNDKATFDAMRGTRPAGTSTTSESRGNGK